MLHCTIIFGYCANASKVYVLFKECDVRNIYLSIHPPSIHLTATKIHN